MKCKVFINKVYIKVCNIYQYIDISDNIYNKIYNKINKVNNKRYNKCVIIYITDKL